MARKPGWYDDPDGLPGVYRWWNGTTWTVDVTTEPGAGVSPGNDAALTPVLSSDAPAAPTTESVDDGYADDAAAQAQRGSRTGSTAGVRAAGRLAVLAFAVGILLGGATLVRPLLDPQDDLSGADEIEVPDLSEIERGPGPDGRYAGGGLSYAAMQGRWTRTLLVSNVPMVDLDGERRIVAEAANGDAHYAFVWLGALDRALVDDDLESTARRFADRFATQGYPDGARLHDASTTTMSVDGADAVRLTRQYDYRVRGTPITGEELVVVLVDAGDVPAVWVASVPDGFPAVRAQAEHAMASLRVVDAAANVSASRG